MPYHFVLHRFIVCCCFLLMACQPTQSASQQTKINAHHYDAFWIWGEIKTAPYLQKAQELYILQGEIRKNKHTQQLIFIPQGVRVLNIPRQKVWLVFRNHELNWSQQQLQPILQRIQHWENVGNHIQGIQIDFDAKTKNLKEYALFLQQLRQQLPQKYRLSITGLLDWTNVKDAETLQCLRENIDELTIQTYQGSKTIVNYQTYLMKVSKLNLPYKIGIVQQGQWDSQLNFASDPNFKGYVVFLLRDYSNFTN